MISRHAQATGQAFENLIDYSNAIYKERGIAVVQKREIPVTITSNRGGKITGHIRKPSAVDYEGFIAGGRSIQFEAKSTRNDKRFDLKQVAEHQVDFLRLSARMGALTLVLVEFSCLSRIFCLSGDYVVRRYDEWKLGGRASIAFREIERMGIEVKSTNGVPVDYLGPFGFGI